MSIEYQVRGTLGKTLRAIIHILQSSNRLSFILIQPLLAKCLVSITPNIKRVTDAQQMIWTNGRNPKIFVVICNTRIRNAKWC